MLPGTTNTSHRTRDKKSELALVARYVLQMLQATFTYLLGRV